MSSISARSNKPAEIGEEPLAPRMIFVLHFFFLLLLIGGGIYAIYYNKYVSEESAKMIYVYLASVSVSVLIIFAIIIGVIIITYKRWV